MASAEHSKDLDQLRHCLAIGLLGLSRPDTHAVAGFDIRAGVRGAEPPPPPGASSPAPLGASSQTPGEVIEVVVIPTRPYGSLAEL